MIFYYTIILFIGLICYLLGSLIIPEEFENESTLLNFAEKIILGSTVLTILIAIFKTYGQTTSSISFILIITFYYYKNKNNNFKISFNFNLLSFIYFTISTVVFLIFHLYFNIHQYSDHIFYAKLSQSIYVNGRESFSSLFGSILKNRGVALYHYSDLWINGFISENLKINPILSLTNIIYPYFSTITFVLISGIVQKNSKNLPKTFLYSLSILFGSAYLISQILSTKQGHHTFWHYGFPDITSFKSIKIYPLIILGLYYFDIKKYSSFTILMAIICCFYFTLIIPIFALTNIGLILIYFTKRISLRKMITYSFIFNISLFLIFSFPIIFNEKIESGSSYENIKHTIHSFKEYIGNWDYYTALFFNYLYRPFVLYPIVTLLIILNLKKNIIPCTMILFSFICAAIFVVIFHNLKDSQQAFSIILSPVMIYQCVNNLNFIKQKWLHLSFICLLILFSILNIKRSSILNNGEFTLNKYEQRILLFTKNHIKNDNWFYYSENPSSNWFYHNKMCSYPILKYRTSKLGIEIAPFFSKDFINYKLKNPSSPVCKINSNMKSFKKLCDKINVKYVYIENINEVDKNFVKIIKPVILNNKTGLYEINLN